MLDKIKLFYAKNKTIANVVLVALAGLLAYKLFKKK
jgi:predicted negative regulator of RcsB-dependent stress response